MKLTNPYKLLISLVLPQLAGAVGSIFTVQAIPVWYSFLEKPLLNPPSWLFGPVWTILYLLMGVALYLVWGRGLESSQVKSAMALFGAQLILNVLWTVVFFGLRNPLAAFFEILILWVSILFTIIYFYKISKTAGLLLVPYILWVSFAAYLNYAIWFLNRSGGLLI